LAAWWPSTEQNDPDEGAGMPSIESVTLEVSGVVAAKDFYADAFDLGNQLRPRASEVPTSGFRGFTLSPLVAQPSTVDELVETALAAGATGLKPAKKQFWGGYSGVVQAPDGTILKVATEAKKDTGPEVRQIDGIVVLLGVADIGKSKEFYVGRGFVVAKSYGSKYVDFDAVAGSIKLGLYKRAGLAKDAGVTADGTGSHRFAIGCDVDGFVDIDGFVWERSSAVGEGTISSSAAG
jgi:predicted lactoylglutathione lyase